MHLPYSENTIFTLLLFGIFKSKIKKKIKIKKIQFYIVAIEKMKIMASILEMANHRAKWSEIYDSEVLVEHIWDNFDLVIFNIILGSFGALVIFLKLHFLH